MKALLRKMLSNSPVYLPIDKMMNRRQKDVFIQLLTESETWSREQVLEWQLKQLRKLVDYAFVKVPYYHRVYTEAGYRMGDLRTWSDFYALPFVSKDDIKANFKNFLSSDFDKLHASICYTGGSTDKPMKFALDKATQIREKAFFEYYWEKNGYSYGEKCVILRGQQVARPDTKKYYALDQTRHYLIIDSRYITDREALSYIDAAIRRFNARVLQAYPSSAYLLAKAYEKMGKQLPPFEIIFLGSENTHEDQVDYIKQSFSAKQVIYHYGHSECAAIATKYRGQKKLGFCPIYGIVELIRDGQAVSSFGEMGEIVSTGFNRATPFIRYRTGDYAISSDYCSTDYMRNYIPVERIEGRQHEFIITKDKRMVSLCSITGAHMRSLSLIGDMQYEQYEVGKLIVYVTDATSDSTVPSSVLNVIKQDFYNTFQDKLDVEVVPVCELRKTAVGKKIMLRQHLNLNEIGK